jgi:hypothetical protein
VISANLTRAALEAAPVIADLSSWLADVAGKAGIAWERLFDAPEEKSLRTLRYELDLASSTIEKLEGRIQELRESPTLGFTTLLDTAQINALQTRIDELRRARLFDSLDLLTNGARLFTQRCVAGLAANREKSLQNLLDSSALATVLVPRLGYEMTTRLVKQSLTEKRPFTALAIERGLLTESDVMAALYSRHQTNEAL